ncbi:MAG TPA: HD domain-containing phosphohydrolase [Thermoleophilaceae bacterium]|nr:HD domain-containing phosphohydrolase [Thermoleophilaceae bacterium]
MEAVASRQSPRFRQLRVGFAVLAAGWLLYLVLIVSDAAVERELLGLPLGDPIYAALLMGAGLLCLARATVDSEERRIWLAFGAGLTLWSFGDLWWMAFLATDAAPPYPSVADALWLSSYVPMAYGIWSLISSRVSWRALGAAAWLDGAIAALAGSAVFAATLLAGPLAAAVQGEPMTFATNLAYPIGDLVLLGCVLAALSATGWRPGRAIALIAAGLLLRALADFVYLDQVTQGTYAGGLLDTLWPAASLLVAAAACLPARSTRREPDWRAFLAPAAFVTTALGLLLFDHFERLPSSAVVLAAVAVAVAAIRMVTMVRATLASTQRDALTDALTGMKNRRSLERDLSRALEDLQPGQRLVFAMFDLNGFKRYNDNFGHPAGDSLLARLGTRLAEAARPGSAYRLGGDEFCVLLPDAGDAEERLARADAALVDQGDGFKISAARGTASIPDEASDPEEVMHLADRRMYAAKLGGRADDHTVEALLRALYEAKPRLEGDLGTIAVLARGVAQRLGLIPEEIDEVVRAAKLHDVGKMAIPDSILNKPSPLDPDEWEYMRKHPVIGERIVAAATPLLPVARLVRSSHERWDGAGYPDGLAGEAIPRGARIVFACDSFEAMTSGRPYRTARTPAEALAELRRCSGTQFDPEVVDALEAVVTERADVTRRAAPRTPSW